MRDAAIFVTIVSFIAGVLFVWGAGNGLYNTQQLLAASGDSIATAAVAEKVDRAMQYLKAAGTCAVIFVVSLLYLVLSAKK
ncbi:hypothetical protein [Corynebacterium lowii]|uniref:Uncharacterized protein n=1 Tax=Corynebacterium lowii TaxID=1544413 RepID=A0A0Q0YNF1_9CORY|nr:hypothetical protein [Corynebacterium lowii]KQB83995.1 hypothetical protein Clow_02196 [Corynebacterium lowii]MDP9852755.1 ABC-type spermidine/putrescine transport system permease subunit I [Corynebacterium lowii]